MLAFLQEPLSECRPAGPFKRESHESIHRKFLALLKPHSKTLEASVSAKFVISLGIMYFTFYLAFINSL